VYSYEYDGGYPVMHLFNEIRAAVPRESRAKSVGVSAHSPGILTIDSPTGLVQRLMVALTALSDTQFAYDALHQWSRFKPRRANELPSSARRDLDTLCGLLGIDLVSVLPHERIASADQVNSALLAAGKIVAAYYRKLWYLLKPADDVQFLDIPTSIEGGSDIYDEDEDDEFDVVED
jgi:hypothetical protein